MNSSTLWILMYFFLLSGHSFPSKVNLWSYRRWNQNYRRNSVPTNSLLSSILQASLILEVCGREVAVGHQPVSEDMLSTVLVEAEGILSSKPLGYTFSDVASLDPVTPSMLLMGQRDSTLPQVTYAPESMGWRRWRQSQILADLLWSQFTHDYLPTLQSRNKWLTATDKEDIIVLVMDPQLP